MRIALDIDDVLACFMEAYKEKFETDKHPNRLLSAIITKNMWKVRKDRQFWTSLKVKNILNFVPVLYCTKRINNKSYTREWLVNNNFPDKPIYQIYNQSANKAVKIKGRCDVLIDDSIRNVKQAIAYGLPALLYTTPENINYDFPYRISTLDINEITQVYNKQINGKL